MQTELQPKTKPENRYRLMKFRSRKDPTYEPKKFRHPFFSKSEEKSTVTRSQIVVMMEYVRELKEFNKLHEHLDLSGEVNKINNWIAKESLTA